MANRVFVSVQENLKEPEWIGKIEPFMQKVLSKLNYDNEELSIMFCTDDFIQDLNKTYREIDNPTDVLSFENGEKYTDEEGEWLSVGDIVLSLETLPKNAEYFEVSENSELKRLLIHGLLHLNGFDHGEEHIEKGVQPKCEMLILQEDLLKDFADEKIME